MPSAISSISIVLLLPLFVASLEDNHESEPLSGQIYTLNCCQPACNISNGILVIRDTSEQIPEDAFSCQPGLYVSSSDSEGREFDPRQVHDNLSVPLWVYMHFPLPEHQN